MTDNEFYSILSRCMPDYNVVENIGSGNYGSVYKCERDGIYYAIKIISVPSNEKELQSLLARSDNEVVQAYLKDKVEGYRKEIMLMAELKGNRSIVNIEDYKILESENGLWYIVIRMELLTSLTLYASKNELDENEVIRLGIDICDALSICEKHNIIHRDIKPENIMRHVEGTFKLGDFGVAKQLSKTTAGTIAGTEGFMAPEVYKGQEYNQTADIYSLGIVLYYYLNNKKMPHVAPNDKSLIAEQQAIEKRMTDKAPLPLPPKASKNLGQIIVKACMFDKSCRYCSAADMRADLIKALNGEIVTVDLAPSSERGTIAQFNDKKTMAQSNNKKENGGVDTPFTGDIVDNTSEERAKSRNRSTEAFDEHNKPKKKKKGLIVVLAVICIVALGIGGFTVYRKLFAGPEPGIYLDENGNEYEVLSQKAMEEAYNKGVQYSDQGEYLVAIDEFKKVSEYSAKYKEAQKAIEAALNSYKNDLIEKSESYSDSGNYEMALSLLESGVAMFGDSDDISVQRRNILNKLKLESITKANESQQNGAYTEAFSYVQTAIAYLPDDMELKGLYTQLEAMSIMTSALEDAENYERAEDYEKLFSVLEEAISKIGSNSSMASSKLSLAYEEYKTDLLSIIENQIKNPTTVAEYSRAIETLNMAVKLFPNEYELKQKQEALQQMKVALDVILDAEDYRREYNYRNAFSTLRSGMTSVISDRDAYKEVEDTYNSWRKEYVDDLYSEIGKPRSVTDYEKAISKVEAALKDLPDDSELLAKLSELQSKKPIDILKTNIASTMSYYLGNKEKWVKNTVYKDSDVSYNRHVYTGEFTDNYGNTRKDSLMLRTYDYYVATYAIYDCENFSLLSGTISVYDDSKSYGGNLYVEIIGLADEMDEEVLYKKNFVSGIKPQDVQLDISGYTSVKLQISNYDENGKEWKRYYLFKDASGVIFSDFVLSN